MANTVGTLVRLRAKIGFFLVLGWMDLFAGRLILFLHSRGLQKDNPPPIGASHSETANAIGPILQGSRHDI